MLRDIIIEKIKDDGTKLEIRVSLYNGKFSISDIGIKRKGKRKFTYMMHSLSDLFSYRVLDFEGRDKMKIDNFIKEAGVELLNEALIEAWESIKPELLPLDGKEKEAYDN